MTFYECVFAPSAATPRDAIRVAQIVSDNGESAYEAFSPGAFAGWGQYEIPALVDHDGTKRAGTVTGLYAHGDWHRATFMLDGPYADLAADLIERCGNVSPKFEPLEKDHHLATPITMDHTPTHWYTRAKLVEISIASPGAMPWYVGAKVERSHQWHPPARKPTPKPLQARQVTDPTYGEGQILRRPGIGTFLGIR